MSKKQYKFDHDSLTYEVVENTTKARIISILSHLGTGTLIATITLFISFSFFKSPKHIQRELENKELNKKLTDLNKRVQNMKVVIQDFEKRDDYIYRSIFEADPISPGLRNAGRGGRNRYEDFEKLEDAALLVETAKEIDQLSMRLYVQSKSYDELYNLVENKQKMLSHLPAIQPVKNEDLTRLASGYGMRIHPILKIRKMHTGMDFTAPKGTDVMVTGDGVISKIKYKRGGYGKHIIVDHGFGYKTLYAHLNGFNVKKGQKVKRGDIIGFVGNTGRSSGPHLHYEVIRDKKKVNPVYYYYNDLTPEEYEQLLEISAHSNQSMD